MLDKNTTSPDRVELNTLKTYEVEISPDDGEKIPVVVLGHWVWDRDVFAPGRKVYRFEVRRVLAALSEEKLIDLKGLIPIGKGGQVYQEVLAKAALAKRPKGVELA